MSRLMKKCAIGVAVTAALGLAIGEAQAGALGDSSMLLSNLTFFKGSTTTTILDKSDFTNVLFTNSGAVSASMGIGGAAANGNGTPLDLAPVCVGACPAIANNTYPVISGATGNPTSTFATADQNESGSPITGLTDSTGKAITTRATVNNAAYADVATNGNPNSQANNNLSALFDFTTANDTAVTFRFDARAYLEAFTAATENFPTDAHAAYKVCFTVTNLDTGGTTVINYCPDGSTITGGFNSFGIVTETSDPFSLNSQVSRNAPGNGASLPTGEVWGVERTGTFQATSIVLTGGTHYQLAAINQTTADASRFVPEPGTLALLGVALFGLAATGRSSRRKS